MVIKAVFAHLAFIKTTSSFQVIFSADQTYELMFCLGELTSSMSTTAKGADRPMQVCTSSNTLNKCLHTKSVSNGYH